MAIMVTSDQSSHLTKEVKISEIFYSIQGEAGYAGQKCIFIRLTGCPLRCVWCDTTYSFHGGETATVSAILSEIRKYPCNLVEITGGEPLLQKSCYALFEALHEKEYKVLLETSGAIAIDKVPSFVTIIMDLKAPASGESSKNLWTNLDFLKQEDSLKIVAG